jgi:hypothetical protein
VQPYVHYLPLAHDLSDLHTQIEWARRNPVAARAMIRRAQQFVEQWVQTPRVNAYLLEMLRRYAYLQRFVPEVGPGAVQVFLKPDLYDLMVVSQEYTCRHWWNSEGKATAA